jgi:hypothetical protein
MTSARVEDVEKNDDTLGQASSSHDGLEDVSRQEPCDYGNVRIDSIRQKNRVLRFLANLESRIDRFANFEAMGVERVPEDQRKPPQMLNVGIYWR